MAVGGKASGYANTDALTLADLSVQELLIAALRDMGPVVRRCRIEAEEGSGDLARFATDGEWTLGIDPIDGTLAYRDRTGNDYSVMVHARTRETVHYSLVYFPEVGAEGTWLEARSDRVAVGPDDLTRTACAALNALPPIAAGSHRRNRRILVAGFLGHERERARDVTAAGLDGVLDVDLAGAVYPLMARGEIGGVLFHTPNVYDFPVCLHLARLFGGDAIWAHDGQPVDFRSIWRDARSNMLRLPGIVAAAFDRDALSTLSDLARDWSRDRYPV